MEKVVFVGLDVVQMLSKGLLRHLRDCLSISMELFDKILCPLMHGCNK